MKNIWFIILILILFSSCTFRATRDGDTMMLQGLSEGSAEWPDGSKIKKGKPVPIPDILPLER